MSLHSEYRGRWSASQSVTSDHLLHLLTHAMPPDERWRFTTGRDDSFIRPVTQHLILDFSNLEPEGLDPSLIEAAMLALLPLMDSTLPIELVPGLNAWDASVYQVIDGVLYVSPAEYRPAQGHELRRVSLSLAQ